MTAGVATDAGIDQATVHLDALALREEQRTRALPWTFEDDDFPAELSLPILEPRATKQRRREIDETSSTLLNFVSHMTLTDLRSSFTSPSFSRAHPTETPVKRTSTGSEEPCVATTTLLALGHKQPTSTTTNTTQWSLTTPETMKATLSTPQAHRLGSQKRKSPTQQQIHCTPVDGNRPLLIPTLSTMTNRMPMTSCSTTSLQNTNNSQLQERKKSKSHMTFLLNSAPMLPASPDLENHQRVMTDFRWQQQQQIGLHPPPCFSSPMNGVTLVHPNILRQAVAAAASTTPTPTGPRRTVVSLPTADLPSLEEVESSARKSLRMKRRESLLYALRLTATES
jgi:hypothetical protein